MARIQGATFEYVYGDEVTTWAEEVFQMLKSRLRCEHSHFDGTCNPDNPKHWFKTFLDSSDVDIYHQSYVIDDGALPPKVVEELKKEYAGTVYYNRFILGQWAPAEGLVYAFFRPMLIRFPLPRCQVAGRGTSLLTTARQIPALWACGVSRTVRRTGRTNTTLTAAKQGGSTQTRSITKHWRTLPETGKSRL